MKKYRFLLSIFLVLALAAGCGGTTDDADDKKSENGVVQEEKEGIRKINQEIANDEVIQATLVDIKKVEDEVFGNSIEVKFEVVNKTDKTIEVQARQVSADGKMIDESMLSMSQEIAPGKTADAVLTIMEFEGTELPKMEDNFEMILHVFSWDDMEFEHDYPVKVEF